MNGVGVGEGGNEVRGYGEVGEMGVIGVEIRMKKKIKPI